MKETSIHWMTQILEMEKLTDYTCNPEYVSEWHRLMTEQETFITKVFRNSHDLGLGPHTEMKINVEGIGMVEVGGLMKYPHSLLSEAFDLKMRMTAYWNLTQKRVNTRKLNLHFLDLHLIHWSKNVIYICRRCVNGI
ncbi:unnamed protein product [Prunus brigantina]